MQCVQVDVGGDLGDDAAIDISDDIISKKS